MDQAGTTDQHIKGAGDQYKLKYGQNAADGDLGGFVKRKIDPAKGRAREMPEGGGDNDVAQHQRQEEFSQVADQLFGVFHDVRRGEISQILQQPIQ